jgi:hypothetical protein
VISLSVAMMAHPKRAEQVEQILARLDRDDVQVVWDERNSRWDTGKRAMLAYDPGCSHHAVIQDDVLVCRDLFAGVEAALHQMPHDVPLCGYVGRVRPYAEMVTMAAAVARQRGASFLTMHTLNWGPLVVVPTDCIEEMVEHCDTLTDIPNYDRRLSRYWELQRHLLVWYTWPSLVDHADGPSLVPGRIGTDRRKAQHTRVAHTFIGEDASALDVDWSGLAIDAEHLTMPDGKILLRNVATGQELRLPPHSARVRRLRGLPSWELITEGVTA